MDNKDKLIGLRYGNLIVLGKGEDYISPSGHKLGRLKCQCDCGNIINCTKAQLKRGQKSCGCISNREDLTGRTYGKLRVMYAVDDYVSPKGSRMSRWHCKCECGNEKDILGMSLKNGDAKSCGCMGRRKINGISKNGEGKQKSKSVEIIGQTFGDLFVLSKVIDSNPPKYLCRCSCGVETVAYKKYLVSGRKTHCGCKTVRKSGADNRNFHDYVGKTLGELIVLEELPPHITPNGSKQRIVRCRCSCGTETTTRLENAKKNGKCNKCLRKDKRVDITGKCFGKLVVISMADDYISPSGHRLSRCNCQCDCGKTTIVNMSGLVTGSTKSCGCIANSRGLLKDHPEYMCKYDYEKNKNLDLSKLTVASSKKAWWKCDKCGNSWPAVISSQTNLKKDHGCPYCSGRFVIKGKTDLASQKPEMLDEWDFDKNTIQPDEISCYSGQKVYWRCKECGHSWPQTVANRVSGSGCPKCNKENVNSFCEQALFYYVKQYFPDAINSDMHIGMELDVYVSSLNVAFEYDGEAWHKTAKKETIDIKKNQACKDNGITLIRIREPKLKSIEDCIVFRREDSISNLSLDYVIFEALHYLLPDQVIDIDTTRDTPKILEQYVVKKYENSLAYCFPDIAAEWHPTKNGLLTPDKVSKASRYTVWWLGKCGHEWPMSVSDRTVTFVRKNGRIKKPYGCPFCSGKRLGEGINDLQTRYPEIAKEWHPTKNGELTPSKIMPGSNKPVWWLGTCGHEWPASPNKRCLSKQGCPICFKSKRSPAVVCVETGEMFDSGISAAKKVGLLSPQSIYACCRGKARTAGGYHWKYID